MDDALAYFITFRTYGSWLHGDARGTVDRRHNRYQSPKLAADPIRESRSAALMTGPAVTLSSEQRAVVEAAAREVCAYRGWAIRALRARTNHVHLVVYAPKHTPERVMNDVKGYGTRGLRRAGLMGLDARVWEYHGSTPRIYDEEALRAAIDYVLNQQD